MKLKIIAIILSVILSCESSLWALQPNLYLLRPLALNEASSDNLHNEPKPNRRQALSMILGEVISMSALQQFLPDRFGVNVSDHLYIWGNDLLRDENTMLNIINYSKANSIEIIYLNFFEADKQTHSKDRCEDFIKIAHHHGLKVFIHIADSWWGVTGQEDMTIKRSLDNIDKYMPLILKNVNNAMQIKGIDGIYFHFEPYVVNPPWSPQDREQYIGRWIKLLNGIKNITAQKGIPLMVNTTIDYKRGPAFPRKSLLGKDRAILKDGAQVNLRIAQIADIRNVWLQGLSEIGILDVRELTAEQIIDLISLTTQQGPFVINIEGKMPDTPDDAKTRKFYREVEKTKTILKKNPHFKGLTVFISDEGIPKKYAPLGKRRASTVTRQESLAILSGI